MSLFVILVSIILGAIYLGTGYFGAVMVTKIWISTGKFPNTFLLRFSQAICIILGPIIPCLIIIGIVLIYIVLSLISMVAWGVKAIKDKKSL